jgi:hypothetical protein
MLTQWLLPNNYRARKDAIGTKLGELMDLIDNIKVGDTKVKVRMCVVGFKDDCLVNSQMPRGSDMAISLPHKVL